MSFATLFAAQNPLFWARLDETSGTSAANSGSVGGSGTHTNGPTVNQASLLADGDGKSVLYDGVNDYTIFAHSSSYDVTAWTLVAVIQKASNPGSNSIIFNKRSVGTNATWALLCNASTGYPQVFANVSGVGKGCTGTYSVCDNQRRVLIATFDSSFVRLYVDGVEASFAPTGGVPDLSTGSVTVGCNANLGGFFAGGIDEVGLCGSVLSLQTIYDLSDLAKYNLLRPVAGISGTPLSGATPLTVQFTGGNTGGTAASWAWDFGDGSTSTSQSPSHQYQTPGTYTVTLTVTNAAGSSVATQSSYITTTAPLPSRANIGSLIGL